MKLPAGYRATCENRNIVAASAGPRTGVQLALDTASYQPWPWSYPGQSTVEFGGDTDGTRDRYPCTIIVEMCDVNHVGGDVTDTGAIGDWW